MPVFREALHWKQHLLHHCYCFLFWYFYICFYCLEHIFRCLPRCSTQREVWPLLIQMRMNRGTAEGYLTARCLFWKYMGQQELLSDLYRRNRSEISFIGSDFSGDFIKLRATYEVKLPVFWTKWGKLPVKQQIVCKKWTGASLSSAGDEDGAYVYITPYGNAYHSSAECKTLKLSIRSVPRTGISALRSEDGSIYYPCRCAGTSSKNVYITDYGTEYHGNIACSGLKRTVYRVLRSQVGDRTRVCGARSKMVHKFFVCSI